VGLLVRGLVPLLIIGMVVFCLIDCVQTPEYSVRNLPKWAWIVLILLFEVIGCVAWLVAGRPSAADRQREYPTGSPEHDRQRPRRDTAPDDDPEFLRELGRVNTEHEQTLGQWEADLRRREEELRRREQQPPAAE
jgi:hypothetical protein